MISVSRLRKSFGAIRAVDTVNFQVQRGEIVGFLGPNGAGKTTTMRMIAGFLPPDRGEVFLGDVNLWQDPVAAKRHLGYLPEGAPSYGEMIVDDYLQFIASLHGLSGLAREEAVEHVLLQTGLLDVLHRKIETLSKGYKRRVGLAQALIHDPAILILDEPTDGLDPNQKHDMRVLIKKLAAQKAIIISTHILEEVEALCNRVMILHEGRIIADETPDEFKSRMKGAPLDDIFRALTAPKTEEAA